MSYCFSKLMKPVLSVLLLMVALAGQAQLSQFSNTGTDFWVGYGHHEFMESSTDNSQEMTLYLSNPNAQSATVTVTIFKSGNFANPQWSRTYSVPGGQAIDISTTQATARTPATALNPGIGTIPKSTIYDARLYKLAPQVGGQGKFAGKGINITSNIPINAYSHIYGGASSGATTLLPTNTWGYSYTSINTQQTGYDPNDYSWFFVVAKEDNTKIQIIPANPTNESTVQAGVPFETVLNKGEIYQISGGTISGNNRYEMTGSRIYSIKNSAGQCLPIAVFSGSSRTGNDCPNGGGGSGKDNDMQQLFPENAWGKRYLTAPMINNSAGLSSYVNNLYKVIPSDPNTPIFRNGTALTTSLTGLAGGISRYYYYTSSTADELKSTKPFSVVQQVGGCSGMNPDGDPESIVISPIEQGINRVIFYRNTKQSISYNAVTIVVPTAALGSLRIDGQTLAQQGANATATAHPNAPGFSVVQRRWSPSAATNSSVTCDSPFTAITYGGGGPESYGYNAGTYIKNLNVLPDNKNVFDSSTNKFSSFVCKSTPTRIYAKIAYKPISLNWVFNGIGANITPNANQNTGETYPYIVPLDSQLVNGQQFYVYEAPGGPYTFNNAGSYTIPIAAKYTSSTSCDNTDSLYITFEVKNAPKTDFTISYTGCSSDTSTLKADSLSLPYSSTDTRRDTIALYRWKITGGASPDTSTKREFRSLLAVGTNVIRLTAINKFGCFADTVKQFVVNTTAPAAVYISDTTICEGTEIKVAPTTTGTGTGYSWNFGQTLPNGQPDTITTPTKDTLRRTYTKWGTYTITHKVEGLGNCAPIKQIKVHVYAKPSIGFTYPIGCLPSTGLVQFTDTTKIADTTTKKVAWLWNFGDPNASAGNPNTSTAQNPTHTYQVGTYNIYFRVTSDSGCVADSTHSATFAIAPAFAITQPAPVCENGDSILLNFATVTNGVPAATKVFTGPGVDTMTGYFRPWIAGPGVHELRWIYRTTSGICTDTAKTTIRVWAKPYAGFEGPSGGCLAPSGLANFAGYDSTLSDGQTVTYKWKFGDTANLSPSNIDSATTRVASHFYKEGGYTIRYSVQTNNGCRMDSVRKFIFSVSPDITLAALPSLCASAAPVNLNQYLTVNNGVNGTRQWFGTGVDTLTGIVNPALAGAGTQTIAVIYTSNGGCPDTAFQNLTVYDLPNKSWTISPSGGCIGPDGKVTFTGNPYLPTDGQTLTYAWNFGDTAAGNVTAANPNTANTRVATHVYKEGTYTIRYTVSTSFGCTFDSVLTQQMSIKPDISLSAMPGVCVNGDTVRLKPFATINNGVIGTYKFYAPGLADSVAGYLVPANAGGPGIKNIRLIYTSLGGCTDTADQTLRLFELPSNQFTISPSGGCIGPDGKVTFIGDPALPTDGQTVTYKWKFGDTANLSATNIDSALTRVATHIYKEGTYTIRYIATTNNNCVHDSVLVQPMSIKPDITLSAMPGVCLNGDTVKLKPFATINNGVIGTYKFYAAGLADSVAGYLIPANAGAGLQNIRLIYTSLGGCTDTADQTLRIFELPNKTFTFDPSGGCIGPDGKVTFSGNPALPSDGQTLTYKWNFGDTANLSSTNIDSATTRVASHFYKEGTYTIRYTVTTNNNCRVDTSITQPLSVKPDISLGALTAGCLTGDTTFLKTVATINNNVIGNYIFRGPGVIDSVNGYFVGNVAGPGNHTITLIYTSLGGCKDTATSNIQMYQSPFAGFTYPLNCLAPNGAAQFVGYDSTLSDGQTQTFQWNFGDTAVGNVTASNPNTATTRVSSHNYREGGYTITYTVTTNQGCKADSTVKAIFGVTPDVSFATLPAGCITKDTLRLAGYITNANGVLGTGRYRGPGIVDSVQGYFVGAVAGAGTHTIRYILTSNNGCADTAEANITMYAPPEVSFTYPTNCLNEVGFAEFFGNVQVPAGQTIASYSWDFGDPNATSGNPNTASTINATHNYSQYDTFAIRFEAVTNQGCRKDTLMEIPFSLKPNLNQPYQPSLPESDTGFTQLIVPAVLNNVPGKGYFTGTGVDSTGRFRPAVAGAGTRTVTYIYNSDFGCADTVDLTIKVFPKPTVALSVTNSVCENATATVTGSGSVLTNTGGAIKYFRWTIMGRTWDTTDLVPLNYQFPTFGNQVVRLQVITDSNAISDVIVDTIRVRDNPVASLTTPASICLPNGAATFTSTSTTQDGSRIQVGTWNFGDGSAPLTTSNTSVNHTYAPATIDSVRLSLQVTTQYGCTDDTAFYYKQFFEKPVASFRIDPDTFCQNTPTLITNLSTARNSVLTGYFWEFGDGTTSRLAAPTKNYTFPGDYPVTLSVTSREGCTSDTTASYNVRVLLQPRIDAGVNKVVPQGTIVQFLAITNDPSNDIRWTPPTGLSSDTVLRPTLIANANQMYLVEALNEGGCVAYDSVMVSVMRPFDIPNAFSPNGDGINDLWSIPRLADYPGATMQIFNRGGQMVFNGQGVTSWDGKRNGTPVPVGTYYYIIDRKNGYAPITGYVLILQ